MPLLRSSLAAAVDSHLFILQHSHRLRRLYKKAARDSYREYVEQGKRPIDETEFCRRRRLLRRKLKYGLLDQKTYQRELSHYAESLRAVPAVRTYIVTPMTSRTRGTGPYALIANRLKE